MSNMQKKIDSFLHLSKYHKNFTMVELLVVISIIMILAALLLSTLQNARKQADTIKCGNNLKQIAIGMFSYASEYNYFPPRAYYNGTSGDQEGGWIQILRETGNLNDKTTTIISKAEGAGACPTARKNGMGVMRRTDYGINAMITVAPTSSIPNRRHLRIENLKSPSSTYLLADAWVAFDQYRRTTGAISAPYTALDAPVSSYSPHRRHNSSSIVSGVANMIYTDGHLSRISTWLLTDTSIEWKGY